MDALSIIALSKLQRIPLLLAAAYSANNYSLTTTRSVIDSTNLSVQFRSPESGKVLLRTSYNFSVNNGVLLYTGWNDQGVQVGADDIGGYVDVAVPMRLLQSAARVVSGLTPDLVYSFDLTAYYVPVAGSSTPQLGPVCLECWAVPTSPPS